MNKLASRPTGSEWLPPRDAWLIDPDSEKIETPVDDMGLVDVKQFIRDVSGTIDPAYDWRRHFTDIHHLYWPSADYPQAHDMADLNPAKFRNLPINKVLVWREFHNWVHRASLPPPQPSPEIMRELSNAYLATRGLFVAARNVVAVDRIVRKREEAIKENPDILPAEAHGIDHIGHAVFARERERRLRGVELHMARVAMVPPEFRLAEIPDNLDQDPHLITRTLGHVAAPGSIVLTRMAVA